MDEGEINSITSEMLERIQQNSGCSFVSRLVTLRERAKWHTAVLIGDDLPTAIAESLASSQDAEVGLLIFPTITAPPQVADLLNSFPTSRWKILDADEGGRASELTAIGLQWTLPDRKYVTNAMGFGDFETMPPTRRAPYTAIALRLKGPKPNRKKEPRIIDHKKGTRLVSFGDVPTLLDPGDRDMHRKNLDATSEQKALRLAGHPTEQFGESLSTVAFTFAAELRPLFFKTGKKRG